MQKKIGLLLLLLCMAACAPQAVYEMQQGQEFSAQQYLDAGHWRLQGRLVLKGDDVLTANIQWQHDALVDDLKLAGMLGLGAIRITLDDDGISLDQGQGNKKTSRDVDAFIAEEIGFIVPISALRFWVLGVPLQNEPVKQLTDGFEQLGWQVKYKGYLQTTAGAMPHKISVTKNSLKLKLVVDRWEIE
ncbi:MAG: outer membrane lipoprotein LolB [Methyloprofundus sp.]|nr:outer membrane lipoprotein LolB [Methyloprofundus sp.]